MPTAAEDQGETARNERLSVLGSLVSGLAHEIRTPLAAATNHVSLLQTRLSGPLPPALVDAPGHAAATLDALERINDLVERLRPFARADIERRVAPRSLDEIAREALGIFLVANPGSRATLGDLAGTPPVPVDRLLIAHAILRLAERLWETQRGPVRFYTRETPLAVELTVEAPNPPRSLSASDAAIQTARRIVEAHGGVVTVRTEDPRIAAVVLSFPKPSSTEILRV